MKQNKLSKYIFWIFLTGLTKLETAWAKQNGAIPFNDTEVSCIFNGYKNFSISKTMNLSDAIDTCCPEGFKYKENSFSVNCVPENSLRGRINVGDIDCYYCRTNNVKYNQMRGDPQEEMYTYNCQLFSEKCNELCNDNPTCSGSCYRGFHWCHQRKECLHDSIQCDDCGVNMVHCNNTCIDIQAFKTNRAEYKICNSGDCVPKEDRCHRKTSIGCPKEHWSCGSACLHKANFTKYRPCDNEVQNIHNCIPIGTECRKNPLKLIPTDGSKVTVKFIVILCIIFLFLVIATVILINCLIRRKIRRNEIIFVDDNPEYGMAQEEYTATEVTDTNEYYGEDV